MNFDDKYDPKKLKVSLSEEQLNRFLKRAWPVEILKIERLNKGASHINYKLSDGSGETILLRLSDKLDQHFNTEVSILSFLSEQIKAPKVLYAELLAPELDHHAAFLEYLPGEDLCDVEDEMSLENKKLLATELGEYLGLVHSFKFSEGGFLNEHLKVYEPFKESCFEDFYQFIFNSFNNPWVIKRLPQESIKKLKIYLEKNAEAWDQITDDPCLVHGEFNAQNIRVIKQDELWSLAGVVDWEFCFSGHGMVDLGRFFRFQDESSDYREHFIEAYQAKGHKLPDCWLKQAQFFDLVSILQILMRRDEYPRSFKTCLELLGRYN